MTLIAAELLREGPEPAALRKSGYAFWRSPVAWTSLETGVAAVGSLSDVLNGRVEVNVPQLLEDVGHLAATNELAGIVHGLSAAFSKAQGLMAGTHTDSSDGHSAQYGNRYRSSRGSSGERPGRQRIVPQGSACGARSSGTYGTLPTMLGVVLVQPYSDGQRAEVLALSVRAWSSVFPLSQLAVPAFVYDSFYPHGWEARQVAELATLLDGEPHNVDVAISGPVVTGWVCTRLHPEDRMGEIYVLAVDPDHQRQGVGTALMDHALKRASAAGMQMVMVETGDDPGHAPARASYEAAGFERWPVARYFKQLG